jgi:hypothetical protein
MSGDFVWVKMLFLGDEMCRLQWFLLVISRLFERRVGKFGGTVQRSLCAKFLSRHCDLGALCHCAGAYLGIDWGR